jgi:hypothetical protein
MKSVDLPSITYNDLISSCIGSIDSEELRNRLETALAHLLRAGVAYDLAATHANLFQTACFTGNDDDVVVESVTKKNSKIYILHRWFPQTSPAESITMI